MAHDVAYYDVDETRLIQSTVLEIFTKFLRLSMNVCLKSFKIKTENWYGI